MPVTKLESSDAKTIEVGQYGHVSLNASNVAADRLHRRVELSLTAARDEDVGAFFRRRASPQRNLFLWCHQ
jgi:hypothetical protein